MVVETAERQRVAVMVASCELRVTVGGPPQKKVIFQIPNMKILSKPIHCNRSQYDFLKVW